MGGRRAVRASGITSKEKGQSLQKRIAAILQTKKFFCFVIIFMSSHGTRDVIS